LKKKTVKSRTQHPCRAVFWKNEAEFTVTLQIRR
jgi:hypothetical protein